MKNSTGYTLLASCKSNAVNVKMPYKSTIVKVLVILAWISSRSASTC